MPAPHCKLRWRFALAAALSLTPVAAAAAPVTATCSPTKVRVMASTIDGTQTTLTEWKSIPEAVVSFTQGGSGPSCVIVRFSAMAFTTSVNVQVRATIDDASVAEPPLVDFKEKNPSGASGAHAYDFLFPNVEPGAHVVRIQFRLVFKDGTGYINRHTTIVEHAP